jgi:hypothetical protein
MTQQNPKNSHFVRNRGLRAVHGNRPIKAKRRPFQFPLPLSTSPEPHAFRRQNLCFCLIVLHGTLYELHRFATTDRFRLLSRRMRAQEFIDQFADNLLLTNISEIA